MSSVIIFYSKNGNTKLGAEVLGKRINSKVIELTEKKKGNALQAVFKKASTLSEPYEKEIINFDTVYLMQPIWGSNAVPAMNAFLKSADFSGKNVVVITFQADKQCKGSDKVHQYITKKVEEKGGKVKKCYAFVGDYMGRCFDEKTIGQQIEKIEVTE